MFRALLAGALVSGSVAFAQAAPVDAPSVGRVRWGVSGGPGTFLPGPLIAFNAEGRIGWQVNRLFGAFLSLGAHAGFGLGGGLSPDARNASAGVGADSFWYLGAIAELMLADLFFVAGGPLLARGGWAFVTQTADANGAITQNALAAGGFMPGLDLKLGVGFGQPQRSGRRSQFSLAADVMLVFAPNAVLGQQSVNGQAVDVRGTAIGVAPMLMFGYDAR